MIQLRDYQKEISNAATIALQTYKIAYLAMEVRTGKTLTALVTGDRFGAENVLFITKKKAIASIQQDYDTLSPTYAITVTNFESVHKVNGGFDLVIIDEAHSIGGFPKPSEKAKLLKAIYVGLPIIFLSGTPSPESYSQLYHQLWVSSFSPWKEHKTFYKWVKAGYVKAKQVKINGYLINDYKNADQERIQADTAPFFFTYAQQQAGFMQTISEEILSVPMTRETSDLIADLRSDNITSVDGYTILADTPAKLLSKLHQLSSGTVIDEDGGYHIIDRSKAKFIRERFAGQKLAIFYVFRSELELLKEFFSDWTAEPADFQNNMDRTFLGQFRSAREGIRLDTADALVFYNLEFSYLSYEQARNRLQSKDREKPARLYFITSDCGVESYVLEAVKNKQDFTLSWYGKRIGK